MGKDLVTDEITVIMPAYNAERLLPATLDSIFKQSYYKKVKCGKI